MQMANVKIGFERKERNKLINAAFLSLVIQPILPQRGPAYKLKSRSIEIL